jgi:hypothetical protein
MDTRMLLNVTFLISNLHPSLRIPSCLIKLRFPTKTHLFHPCSMPCQSIAPGCDNPQNAGKEQKSSWCSSLCRFLWFPVTAYILGPKICFATYFWKPSLCPSFIVRYQLSHPYKTTLKFIVLYILIFCVQIAYGKTVDVRQNNNRHSLNLICS